MDKSVIETRARLAIAPLVPHNTDAPYCGERSDAGRSLPPYYLVYFLLVDLLGFKCFGRGEKVAWSIPVDFEGTNFVIEHRKFGLGIFAKTLPADEAPAEEVAKRIHAGVKAAEPYFEDLAQSAATGSSLNVVNNAIELFNRFAYLAEQYDKKRTEAHERRNERIRTDLPSEFGQAWGITDPSKKIRREAQWYALSAIEAFFSWSEHVFIHLAIIQGRLTTGEDVARLADANWDKKFKAAFDLSNAETKSFYDRMLVLRRQIRNFVAHGSFGRDGQAFSFHSSVGAVPLLLPHRHGNDVFRFGDGVNFVADDAMTLIKDFVKHTWAGPRAAAKTYIQDSDLPLILSMAADGTYARAMSSEETMMKFVEYQNYIADQYANMDF